VVDQKTFGATTDEVLINRAFKFFDLDNDGGVTIDEFGKAMEKLGVFIPTRHNLEQIFSEYDTN
jgi:Ca2+-binding EF-hand superfamily protein